MSCSKTATSSIPKTALTARPISPSKTAKSPLWDRSYPAPRNDKPRSPASTSPPASSTSTCTCTAALMPGSSRPSQPAARSHHLRRYGRCWVQGYCRFQETIMDQSITRVLAFVNIVGAGMTGPPEQDTTDMDPIPCARCGRALSRAHRRGQVGPFWRTGMGIDQRSH